MAKSNDRGSQDDGGVLHENDDVADLSYEQARDELVSIVAQLESGQSGLEESMRLWRRGEALAARCSTWLDGAEAALAEGAGQQSPGRD